MSRYYFLGSSFALNSKMKSIGSKTIISVFFSLRLWLEFLLSLGHIAAISIRLLYRDIVHNTIVYLLPILVRSAGDERRGGLASKDVGSSLGIPQGDVHKILIYHKQQIFSYRIDKAVSLKSPPLKIGLDIDLVCPTSSFFTNIVITLSWMGAIWRPCSIRRGGAKLLFSRLCVVDYFGIQP